MSKYKIYFHSIAFSLCLCFAENRSLRYQKSEISWISIALRRPLLELYQVLLTLKVKSYKSILNSIGKKALRMSRILSKASVRLLQTYCSNSAFLRYVKYNIDSHTYTHMLKYDIYINKYLRRPTYNILVYI